MPFHIMEEEQYFYKTESRGYYLARRYAVPIHVYPEASPRSATIVGTAVETMV